MHACVCITSADAQMHAAAALWRLLGVPGSRNTDLDFVVLTNWTRFTVIAQSTALAAKPMSGCTFCVLGLASIAYCSTARKCWSSKHALYPMQSMSACTSVFTRVAAVWPPLNWHDQVDEHKRARCNGTLESFKARSKYVSAQRRRASGTRGPSVGNGPHPLERDTKIFLHQAAALAHHSAWPHATRRIACPCENTAPPMLPPDLASRAAVFGLALPPSTKSQSLAAALSETTIATRLGSQPHSNCNGPAQRITKPGRRWLTALARRCNPRHATSLCLLQVAAEQASMIGARLGFAKSGKAGCLKVSMLRHFACSSRVSSRTESSAA